MNKTLQTLKFLIGWPLSVIAIIFVIKFSGSKLSEIIPKIHSINYFLLFLSFVLFILYFLLRSFLWKKILEYKGHRIGFGINSYLWGFSEFKRYIPGSIWSFFSRVSLFSDLGIDKKIVGYAILDEVQLIIISCGLISILSIPFMLGIGNKNLNQMEELIAGSVVGILIYFVVVAYIFKKRLNSKNLFSNIFLPGYILSQKISLTLVSLLAFFAFGTATLIASLSIFNLSPDLFLMLSAFYVFALLVGYLSFITPVGLGVREAVVTLGFSSLISLSNAGFLSIFTRVILVFSEVIFLIIILIYKFLNKNAAKN